MKNRIFLSLISVLFITSCLDYSQVTTLKTDNSGKMYIHYWTKTMPEMDSLFINKLGLFNKDSLAHQFRAGFTHLNYAEVFKNYSDSTLHAQIEFEFTNFDSLNYIRFFKNAQFSIKDGPNNTKIFSQFIQPIATGFGFTSQSLSVKYTYYLPGEIFKHNAHTISRNKLYWEFNLDDIGAGQVITATYIPFKLKETPPWILILAGVVILIVLIFLLRKRKA